MAQYSYYWGGTTVGDATLAPYDDDEFSDNWALLHTHSRVYQGVIYTATTTYSSMLACTNPAGTTIRIANGAALVDGKIFKNTANVDFAVSAPGAGTNYYTVVLQKDFAAQTVRLAMLGPNALAYPTVTQNDGVLWEVAIWRVAITNAGAITITDVRVCIDPLILMFNNSALSATLGGDTRGAIANDLQRSRSARTQVASGDYATITGGYKNTASGKASFIGGGSENVASANGSAIAGGSVNTASGGGSVISGGSTNTASGSNAAVAGGNTVVASGDYSLAAGFETTASGQYSLAAGSTTIASGDGAVAFGVSSEATGDYSIAASYDSVASGAGSIAIGSACAASAVNSIALQNQALADKYGQIAVGNSDYQMSWLMVRGLITHATNGWYDLKIGSGGGDSLLTIPASTIWGFEVLVVNSSDAVFNLVGAIKRDGAGNTTLLAETGTAINNPGANYDVQAIADDVNEALIIQVKEVAGSSAVIYWAAKVALMEL